VQKRFTKRVKGMKALSYNERLKHLNLESLQVRRLKNDLVLCYKMLHGLVDLNCSEFLCCLIVYILGVITTNYSNHNVH